MSPSPISYSAGNARAIATARKFTMEWMLHGDAHHRANHLAYVQRYDAVGGTTIDTTPAPLGLAVQLATQDALVGSDYFLDVSASGADNEQIQVLKAGFYRISYTLMGQQTTTTGRTCLVSIIKNGDTIANREPMGDSALYCRHTDRPIGSATATFSTQLAANDYIRLVGLGIGSATGVIQTYAKDSIGSHVRVELERDTGEYPGGARVPELEGVVERLVIAKGVSGSSGNTTVDVKKDGATMLSAAVTVASTDTLKVFDRSNFDDPFVSPDSYLTIEVTGSETPAARDVFVQLVCAPR